MKTIYLLIALFLSPQAFSAETFHCEIDKSVTENGNVSLTEFVVTLGSDGTLTGGYKDSEWGWMSFKKDADSYYKWELNKDGSKHLTVSYYPGHDMYDYDISFGNGVGSLREHTFLDCLGEAEMHAALVCSQI